MTSAEKLVEMMRNQGRYYNGKGIRVGTMVSDKNVELDGLELEPEDYLKNADITLTEGDEVLVGQINDELYVIICKLE